MDNKQLIFCIKGIKVILLVALIISFSTSCNSELLPKALAAQTQSVIDETKVANADVFLKIQHNIDLVTNLKERVQEAQLSGNAISLNSVIDDIESVSNSYEKLAGQRDKIRQDMLTKIKCVENMQNTVDAEVKALWQRREDYSEQMRLISDPNPQITETRREALTRAIKYVDAQIELWRGFSNVQSGIIVEMSDIQNTLDSFLSMIESTSIVFREGLSLLRLQRDIQEAISLFANDIPRMEQLTDAMHKSWDNLDYLLDTLTGIANMSKTIVLE